MLMYQVLGPLVSERLVHDYDAMMKLNFRSKKKTIQLAQQEQSINLVLHVDGD